jgi:hypothetical protein
MRTLYLGIGLALMLVFCGAASAASVPVNQLSGTFVGTNPSVASTNDGVKFGPYADGGSAGGSLFYNGFDGRPLGDISALSFVARYNTTDNTTVGVPYLRIFLEGGNDVIFSPNTQSAPAVDENVDNAYDVVAGTVRYEDDMGNAADSPWATVQTAHSSEVVSGIYVSLGFSAGLDLSGMLTHLGVNGDDFCFNCPPTPSPPVAGPAGPAGAGAAAGTATAAASVSAQSCAGDTVRRLHAPMRRGQRFLTTRATLRGKSLAVSGRTITANLSGRAEGNYNVRLTSRYRMRTGKVVTVKTARNLSVVCA